MADDNDDDEMVTYQGKIRPMASGMGSSGPRDMRDGGSGEAAMDGSRGDNADTAGGSTGPGDAPFTRKRGPQSSTGPGAAPFTAVQAPNRPK